MSERLDHALAVLERGEATVEGRMPFSSNATFLATVRLAGDEMLAVYKPTRGERPLWDFPAGLHRREVAAYRLSEALGWGLVPPTVLRTDGPLGEGSFQLFIEADFEQHYFTLLDDPAHHETLRTICLFDLLANNTDRKSGHCLLDNNGKIWAIDNGLSFHADFKLRTVIWEFGGEPMPGDRLVEVGAFASAGVPAGLGDLLAPIEYEALLARARAVVAERRFPVDPSGRRYPWPMV
ncbi:MAG: SCO1664 family protein [Acidimicrobiales bacterium]